MKVDEQVIATGFWKAFSLSKRRITRDMVRQTFEQYCIDRDLKFLDAFPMRSLDELLTVVPYMEKFNGREILLCSFDEFVPTEMVAKKIAALIDVSGFRIHFPFQNLCLDRHAPPLILEQFNLPHKDVLTLATSEFHDDSRLK